MATKRFKSNKLLVKQLIARFMESPHRSDMHVGDRTDKDKGIYRFHRDGKVRAILKDILVPFENPEFLDGFIPDPKTDGDDLHLTLHIEEDKVFEVMVWDYNLDYRIRHVCIHVDGKPDKYRLSNYVPRKGE
tara:strand:- start:56594 stop:56989 length:396 start_codon:yes stop_codon:yes gene_type:complete